MLGLPKFFAGWEIIPHDHIPWEGRSDPQLSRPEKRRFIRSYYSLWSLLQLTPDLWETRLSQFSFRNLYYIQELCRLLPQSIGGGRYAFQSAERKLLDDVIWEHIKDRHRLVHRKDWSGYWYIFEENEYYPFGRFWDQWQLFLCWTIWTTHRPQGLDADKLQLWEASDEDEPVVCSLT
jgi:hypothetical protein